MAGQRFPQGSRFLAMSRDCRRVALTSSTGNVRVIEASDVGKVVEVKGQRRNGKGNPFTSMGPTSAPTASTSPVPATTARTGSGTPRPAKKCASSTGPTTTPSPAPGRRQRLAVAGRHHKVVHVWDAMAGEKLVTLGPHSIGPVAWLSAPTASGSPAVAGLTVNGMSSLGGAPS